MHLVKSLKFISRQKAQTTLEYFVILAVMAALTFAFLAGVLPKIKRGLIGSNSTTETQNSFFGQALRAMGL
jgi:uncharacterized protein (UPF0333 family)